MNKTLSDFEPVYVCRFHPTDWFHEIGCSHQEWTVKQLQEALNAAKQSNAYLTYLLATPQPNATNEGSAADD